MTTIEVLAAVLMFAAVTAILGAAFGIFFIAPRITGALDRAEADNEELGDQPD